jgi:uroporphyrinogen decarboxylase
MGNLDPVECLWRGSPAEVAASARAAIAAAGHSAFILGSGCEVPVAAPQENLRAMIATPQS